MTDQTEEPDPIEVAAQQAIAACDGDAYAALKAALIGMTMLENDMAELQAAVSMAFLRGRPSRARRGDAA